MQSASTGVRGVKLFNEYSSMRAAWCRFAPLGFLGASLGLAACAGKGTGLDANGRPLGSGGGVGGAITADFQSIQDNVFTPVCTVCHAGAGAPQGLRLDAANSFNLLVNVPSTEVPSLVRIRPGDPDNSYLIQKIEGHASVGAQMPFGGPPLAADVIAAIRQWVSDGAQPATAQAAPAVFKVLSTAPATDDLLIGSLPQVMLAFNQEVDAASVDQQSLRLERVAATGEAGSSELVLAKLSLPAPNPHALLLTPLSPLQPGHYRVLAHTAPGLELADINSRPLTLNSSGVGDDPVILEFDVAGDQ